jgi:hypothetical protein
METCQLIQATFASKVDRLDFFCCTIKAHIQGFEALSLAS